MSTPPVNLRQGAFAKRRQWKVEWPLVRRMAWLVAGILLLTLAIQVASIFRYTFAADALEAETAAVAASVLRSEEHTSELQSLMRISYAFFCLQKNNYTFRGSKSNSKID